MRKCQLCAVRASPLRRTSLALEDTNVSIDLNVVGNAVVFVKADPQGVLIIVTNRNFVKERTSEALSKGDKTGRGVERPIDIPTVPFQKTPRC